MALNLHAIVSRTISALHPNSTMILIRCVGSTNVYGEVSFKYGDCEKLTAQIQTLTPFELQQAATEVLQTDISRKFYMSVKGRQVTAGNTAHNVGSDFIYTIKDKKFWRVYSISEDFTLSGWALAYGSLQTQPLPEVEQALINSGLLEGQDDSECGC